MRPHPPRCSALFFALGLMPLAACYAAGAQSADAGARGGFARARDEIAALETQAAERALPSHGRGKAADELLSLKFAFSLHESPSARANAESPRFLFVAEDATNRAAAATDAPTVLPRFLTPRTFLTDGAVLSETMAQAAPPGSLVGSYSLPEIIEDTGFGIARLAVEVPSTGGPSITVVPPSTVPEPSTLALLLTGGAVWGWQAWRRRQRT